MRVVERPALGDSADQAPLRQVGRQIVERTLEPSVQHVAGDTAFGLEDALERRRRNAHSLADARNAERRVAQVGVDISSQGQPPRVLEVMAP